MSIRNEVRRGTYLDSVVLMQMSRTVAALPGVVEAALMMGTPANKEIMRDAGLLDATGEAAQGNDLIIGIRADDEAAADAALAHAVQQLDTARVPVAAGERLRPRSLRAAVQAMPDANLALISVPGDFAAAEARKAIRAGLHAMIFSDNVPLADELALKEEARERGRLVMGPDCGTAILNGVPLAFANAVPRGGIGVIGATGTGIQEVTSLIAQAGKGISQALGVGGRDLSQEVGGLMTLMAFDALDADLATERVVLISKPPHPDVAQRVIERVAGSQKPVVLCFIGAGELGDLPDNAAAAHTLKDAAELAVAGPRIGGEFDAETAAGSTLPRGPRITGLFAGGTLCAEAQLVLAAAGRTVAANAPVPGAADLTKADDAADIVLDLGADEYTRGRPHPMIDPGVRDKALADALADPAVGVVLLDLVIGYGAHPDPAGHLARTLTAARHDATVVASVTGTERDPQARSRQVAILQRAGVLVAPSNAQAAALAAVLAKRAA
jgi:FdrA protein